MNLSCAFDNVSYEVVVQIPASYLLIFSYNLLKTGNMGGYYFTCTQPPTLEGFGHQSQIPKMSELKET